MALIAGWVDTTITGQDAKKLLQRYVATAPSYTQKELSFESSKFYALAANQHEIYLEQDTLLVNAGNSGFSVPAEQIIKNYLQTGDSFLELNPAE